MVGIPLISWVSVRDLMGEGMAVMLGKREMVDGREEAEEVKW